MVMCEILHIRKKMSSLFKSLLFYLHLKLTKDREGEPYKAQRTRNEVVLSVTHKIFAMKLFLCQPVSTLVPSTTWLEKHKTNYKQNIRQTLLQFIRVFI